MSEREIKIHIERHKAFLEQWADEKLAYKQGYTDGRNYDMAKPLTRQEVENATERAFAHYQGYEDGENYQMSEPREPRFEDDFFNEPSDDDPYEHHTSTIEDIAISKAHIYAVEYDPNAGRVFQRGNYAEVKEAYKAGFLEGFAHRLTQPNVEGEEE